MSAREESSEQLSPAAEAFATFLARLEGGEDPDFDAFCAEHQQLAGKLRRLHTRWRELTGALDDPPAEATLSERIAGAFGSAVDPAITLPDRGAGEAVAGPTSQGSRGPYASRGLLAVGGMGEIHRIWDPDLRRTLAMKVLRAPEDGRAGLRPDPRALSRFLEEAQITAQLEHPGIVPVHELGLDGDGRMYFTMSLIRGRSLEEILRFVREAQEGWTQTRVVGVLLRVCEAVAFAHDKGVVHRDLKPANVMVGRFGETYVMDWGLARVLGREDRKDIRLRNDDASPTLSGVHSSRREVSEAEPDSPLMTMDGDVVGTPIYMAPEQARGEVDRVGPRADVYSIGAMLYELLTGEMPYLPRDTRATSRAVLSRVLGGPPRPVRTVALDVPAELCAICDKAMARDPDGRYASVLELADDLRAYLEGRVVRAHESGTWAELKKWVRRNRGLSAASAAAVLALAIGLVFSLVHKTRADDQARRAEANFALAADAVDRMLTRVGDETLADVPQMDAVRKALLHDALEFHRQFLASRRDDQVVQLDVARAHQRVGTIHWKLGELDAAEAAQRRAVAMFAAVAEREPHRVRLRAELLLARNALGSHVLNRGRHREGQEILDEVLRGLEEDVLRAFPGDPEYVQSQALVLSNLAAAHYRQGDTEQALDCAVRALAIREELARAHPDDLVYQHGAASQCVNSGFMYERLQRYAEARATYDKGVAVMRGLLASRPEHRTYRHEMQKLLNNLGIVQMKPGGGGPALAAATLVEAVGINRRLVADFPGVPAYHGSLGGALSNLAQALLGQRELPAARGHFEEAIAATMVAHTASPEDPQFWGYLQNQYPRLCGVLFELGDHREGARRTEEYAGLTFVRDLDSRFSAYFGKCAGLALRDQSLTASERDALVTHYCDRSLALLRRAVDHGLADAPALLHSDFDVVRSRAGFAALSAEVAARARKHD